MLWNILDSITINMHGNPSYENIIMCKFQWSPFVRWSLFHLSNTEWLFKMNIRLKINVHHGHGVTHMYTVSKWTPWLFFCLFCLLWVLMRVCVSLDRLYYFSNIFFLFTFVFIVNGCANNRNRKIPKRSHRILSKI